MFVMIPLYISTNTDRAHINQPAFGVSGKDATDSIKTEVSAYVIDFSTRIGEIYPYE